MVFALDVGNTNIKCGVFINGELVNSWRMSTDMDRTADEYGITIVSIFKHIDLDPAEVRGIIISSVIPSINYTLEHLCGIYFHIKPLFVSPGIKTGMNLKYDNPKELGADRIVNAIAAYKTYGGPCIVVDFGTATTYGAISANGDFLGGCISPGLKISTEALTRSAAKLPRVELIKPECVICKNTVNAMQAGIIYGYVGQVDFIIKRMKKELGSDALVVATGGLSSLMAAETKAINEVNSLLTLKGLYYIYEKNSALGKTAEVYLFIPPQRKGKGKVQLEMQERFIEAEAVTDDEKTIKTGAQVQVCGVMQGDILIVKRLDKNM